MNKSIIAFVIGIGIGIFLLLIFLIFNDKNSSSSVFERSDIEIRRNINQDKLEVNFEETEGSMLE